MCGYFKVNHYIKMSKLILLPGNRIINFDEVIGDVDKIHMIEVSSLGPYKYNVYIRGEKGDTISFSSEVDATDAMGMLWNEIQKRKKNNDVKAKLNQIITTLEKEVAELKVKFDEFK